MRPEIVLFGDSLTEQSFRPGGWGASLANTYSRKADVLVRGYGGYNTRWALFLLYHLFPLNFGFEECGLWENGPSKAILNKSHKLSTSVMVVNHGRSLVDLMVNHQLIDINERLIKDSTKPPSVVTIFFGANDAAILGRTSERQHVPIEEYKNNLRKIVLHLKECSPTVVVVLITPPPIDEEGRNKYARSLYGENAGKLPERTNEETGVYAKECAELAKEMGLHSIDLWSKMQETEGWQKKFLSDGLHLTPKGNAVVHQEVVRVSSVAWFSAAEMPYNFPHHSQIDWTNPAKAFRERGL
ncbi:hypothetical protein TIFTF001_015094 [Ficus carica]|uniref:SGNH hydrolase-type esterase domain-containing protein n=1 Tax=Ficus carica TaxID=3494 RepID=A0AA88AH62_FICCA|nr:hypothetical protein TIFTF001_015094 [Ficus carica]